MENRENKNNELSRVNRIFYAIGTMIEHMSTVAIAVIYTIGIYKLAQLITKLITL